MEWRAKAKGLGYRRAFVRTGVNQAGVLVKYCTHVCGNLQLLHPVCRLCSGPLCPSAVS